MTGSNYELRELSSEYQPEPVHQEQHLSRHSQPTAEAPTDSLRSLEATEPREQDASPCRAEAVRRRAEISLAAIRARLTCCLKSRANFQPDWELLLDQTEYFANVEIRYGYYWRDGYGGVLPGGYDASSVAAEAVAELFTEQQENGLVLEPHLLKLDLKKRARKIINRLHHRMENRIMRNTADLVPFLTDDGETISVVEKVPAPDRTSLEILLEKEDASRFEDFKARIREALALSGSFSSSSTVFAPVFPSQKIRPGNSSCPLGTFRTSSAVCGGNWPLWGIGPFPELAELGQLF